MDLRGYRLFHCTVGPMVVQQIFCFIILYDSKLIFALYGQLIPLC